MINQEMSQQPLPSAWDPHSTRSSTMRDLQVSRYLQVSDTRVKYVGPGSDDRDAAAVRTNHPVPPDCAVFYFEVEIVNKGRDGFIGVGFSAGEVKLDRLPGRGAGAGRGGGRGGRSRGLEGRCLLCRSAKATWQASMHAYLCVHGEGWGGNGGREAASSHLVTPSVKAPCTPHAAANPNPAAPASFPLAYQS